MSGVDIFSKFLALTLSCLILLQASLVKRYVGTWLFPACLFGLFWFLFTSIPLVLLFELPLDPLPLAFILVCTLSFSAGGLFFRWKRAFLANALKAGVPRYNNGFIRKTFYLTSALAIACVALNSLQQGFVFDEVVADVIGSAAQYATRRGSGEIRANLFGQMSLSLIYLAASLGGALLGASPTRGQRTAWISLSLLPSIVVMITQSAKGPLFLAVSLLYGGILLGRLQAGRLQIFDRKAITPLVGYGIVLMVLVGVSFFSRGLYGSTDFSPQSLTESLVPYFSSYFFGHIYAFADWFAYFTGAPSSFTYSASTETYGLYTFYALFSLLGTTRTIPDGVFQEVYSNGVITTNIYTLLRSLISDFGPIGCIVYMFLSSVVFHWTFYVLLNARRPAFSGAVFVLMVGYFAHSYLGSVLMYNSFYGCLGLLSVVLFVDNLQYGRGRASAAPAIFQAEEASRIPRGTAPVRRIWGSSRGL